MDKARNRKFPGGAILLMNDEFITFLHLTTFFEGVEISFLGTMPTVSKLLSFLALSSFKNCWSSEKYINFEEKIYFFYLGNSSSCGKGHKIASFHLLLIWYKDKNNMPRYLLLKSCYKNTLR